MLYAFARVSATTGMTVADYYQSGKRWMVRVHEKGGKLLEIPAHHKAEVFLDEYLAAAGFGENRKHPLFPTADRKRRLTATPLTRSDVLRMIKRRAREAGLAETVCCHTFRGTGITNFIAHGGTVEKVQAIAGHVDPRTTKLYDRSRDNVTLDDIERITI